MTDDRRHSMTDGPAAGLPAGYAVRPAAPGDQAELTRLYTDHADYERLGAPEPGAAAALIEAVSAASPRVWALVVVPPAAPVGRLAGYAAYSLEFAAWSVRDYLHLDCLYLDPEHRGRGVGAAVLREVAAHGTRLGAPRAEWQTPDWNADAIRFYGRHGALGRAKTRFTLALPGPPGPAPRTPRGEQQ
ncbi:GNAT family N-acetyltransferase [Actinacidiphila sp. ITFR-21]|uniref:GNAT family N-acetyltransferase n=1 Tax=Actinacidiphila sp. ITFR-21 TaxID=3075199 RepID=UPI002889BDFC|nr:GNAT family N-acetyltransferase [Streptomyces sp. ITFR-21]WNI14310.1 GNAT family N-acetyltransferase [Streptomyces sp. ITFR-21]